MYHSLVAILIFWEVVNYFLSSSNSPWQGPSCSQTAWIKLHGHSSPQGPQTPGGRGKRSSALIAGECGRRWSSGNQPSCTSMGSRTKLYRISASSILLYHCYHGYAVTMATLLPWLHYYHEVEDPEERETAVEFSGCGDESHHQVAQEEGHRHQKKQVVCTHAGGEREREWWGGDAITEAHELYGVPNSKRSKLKSIPRCWFLIKPYVQALYIHSLWGGFEVVNISTQYFKGHNIHMSNRPTLTVNNIYNYVQSGHTDCQQPTRSSWSALGLNITSLKWLSKGWTVSNNEEALHSWMYVPKVYEKHKW